MDTFAEWPTYRANSVTGPESIGFLQGSARTSREEVLCVTAGGGLSVLTAGVCWHGGKTIIHPLHLGKTGPGSEGKKGW